MAKQVLPERNAICWY